MWREADQKENTNVNNQDGQNDNAIGDGSETTTGSSTNCKLDQPSEMEFNDKATGG